MDLLGLAMRAGQVVSGDDMVTREAKAGRIAIVLMDAGASGRTREKHTSLCEGREIPLFQISEDTLGKAIGKENRMLAGIKKGPLADKVAALLRGEANP